MKKIKWGCIQPLTGGMYIGAKNAIGHDAEWIISYKGLADPKKKDDVVISAGNEYSLLQWMKKNNCEVPYYTFNHAMFEYPKLNDVSLDGTPDFMDMDIVVAVPVCSGLSAATIAPQDTKDKRNNNMAFITNFTLSVIKPKVYIFENAPQLYSDKGKDMRAQLTKLAEDNGYSVIYYKTDTRMHDNCQRRPRTFILFVRGTGAPKMGYENINRTVAEVLQRIPEGATQQETIAMSEENQAYFDYFNYRWGAEWRTKTRHWVLDTIITDNLWNDLYDFVERGNYSKTAKEKFTKLFDHIQYKVSMDKNYYVILPAKGEPDCVTAAMFKTIPTLIHYSEDRLYTVREWLTFMGMPFDYELAGDIQKEYPKIGQNVPARTAQFIVSEAVRFINEWDTLERTDSNEAMQDNTRHK